MDFGTLVGLVELAGAHYVVATALGALAGAAANFLLGRLWSFRALQGAYLGQAWRYALVSGASLALNSAGVWWFTDRYAVPYPVSKIVTALLVGIGFNFPLHRGFVFR